MNIGASPNFYVSDAVLRLIFMLEHKKGLFGALEDAQHPQSTNRKVIKMHL